VVAGGTVYVGADDYTLYAVDAATGTEHWRFASAGGITTEPAVVGGIVYVGDDTSTLYALGSAHETP
jgi:outer membrane protein assembly factor BamB